MSPPSGPRLPHQHHPPEGVDDQKRHDEVDDRPRGGGAVVEGLDVLPEVERQESGGGARTAGIHAERLHVDHETVHEPSSSAIDRTPLSFGNSMKRKTWSREARRSRRPGNRDAGCPRARKGRIATRPDPVPGVHRDEQDPGVNRGELVVEGDPRAVRPRAADEPGVGVDQHQPHRRDHVPRRHQRQRHQDISPRIRQRPTAARASARWRRRGGSAPQARGPRTGGCAQGSHGTAAR
jgi:hypothetical protein